MGASGGSGEAVGEVTGVPGEAVAESVILV